MEPVFSAKHPSFFMRFKLIGILVSLSSLAAIANAQTPNRITRPIDSAARTPLAGQVHPRLATANDRGRVASDLALSYVTLSFAQTAVQKADLDQLLAAQQNSVSPSYHQWLTPEQYADRFGLSQPDIDKITSWLTGQGLTIAAIARARTWVAVNGTAAQFENAFQTELHTYDVNGETHFANATAPSIPAAFAGVVLSVRGFHDFRLKPRKAVARYTSASGHHYLGPDDFATIYDVAAAYSTGIDGTGQKIAVAGQTRLEANMADVAAFRSNFGLSPNLPQVMLVPGAPDGINSGDLEEADLDVEWSGAVARNATIIYVYAYQDVETAVQYAIDQNIAPVVSVSYGLCELESLPSDFTFSQALARQGNTQGITWFNASGDSGGADCDDSRNSGLAVDLPASVPEVVGVGGTTFAENGGQYWNATNGTNGLTALSYIPETAWNDSAADGTPSSSGGGASIFFPKPSWQTGPGVPNDNARHVPDVSLSASADHDGYLVFNAGGQWVYGGTSVSAQVFGGIAALVNQYQVSTGKQTTPGLGNANAQLYALAQSSPGIFHDITTGDNIVTSDGCGGRVRMCSAVGYTAGVGYDQVTGLGTVDAWNLIRGWSGAPISAPPPSANLTLLSNLSSLSVTDTAFLTATATGVTGITPVGVVVFTAGTTALGSATLVGSNGIATATLAVNGGQLGLGSLGTQTVTATWSGSSSAVTATVTLSGRATSAGYGTPSVTGITNAASFQQVYAPGEIIAIFGSQLAPSPQPASAVPFPLTMQGVLATINGEAAPLWYVSQKQLNVQIPYEIAPGVATLQIDNNGAVTNTTFMVAATAPGIFTDPSGNIANGLAAPSPGQETVLYLTGAGAMSPSVASGAAPAAGVVPQPVQQTTISVGGIPVTTVQFNGIPAGLVGVVQINFTVPSGVRPGVVPVVVTVGGGAPATANLVVSN
jgi:uncharacterized protein (TIGR03437 family)